MTYSDLIYCIIAVPISIYLLSALCLSIALYCTRFPARRSTQPDA